VLIRVLLAAELSKIIFQYALLGAALASWQINATRHLLLGHLANMHYAPL
jgi:hypothetical protein